MSVYHNNHIFKCLDHCCLFLLMLDGVCTLHSKDCLRCSVFMENCKFKQRFKTKVVDMILGINPESGHKSFPYCLTITTSTVDKSDIAPHSEKLY